MHQPILPSISLREEWWHSNNHLSKTSLWSGRKESKEKQTENVGSEGTNEKRDVEIKETQEDDMSGEQRKLESASFQLRR